MNKYPAHLVKMLGGGISIFTPKPIIKHSLLTNSEANSLKYQLVFPLTELPKSPIKSIISNEEEPCEVCTRPAVFYQFDGKPRVLCNTCYDNELRIKADIEEMKKHRSVWDNQITELTNQLVRDLPINNREMQVKAITSIVDIRSALPTDLTDSEKDENLARIVEARLQDLKNRLFPTAMKIIEDLKVEMIIDQKYLNILVPKLRAEEREKYKLFDISYKPTAPKTTATVKAPKMSTSDKQILIAATAMGISVEMYKKTLADSIAKVMGYSCTCAETPGVCKIHVS